MYMSRFIGSSTPAPASNIFIHHPSFSGLFLIVGFRFEATDDGTLGIK